MAKVKTKKEAKELKNSVTKKPGPKVIENTQIKWIVILMAIFILILIFFPLFRYYFIDRFDYKGMKFQKIKEGDLSLFTTNVPVKIKDSSVTKESEESNYLMKFRNDPRELDKIPKDSRIDEEGIKFIKNNKVYISINPNMTACEDNILALVILSSFLRDSGLNVKSAMTDRDYANDTGTPYINCRDSTSNSVIIITSGNETRINQRLTNCYEIVYNNCEITKAFESFILKIVEQYMKTI